LKAFLRWANDHGHSSSTEFRKFLQKRLPQGDKSEKVYLTLPELDLVRQLDLSDSPRLERTRDLFLFQAHTGLRFNDMCRLRAEHIRDGEIQLVTQKNRRAIRIPLLPDAASIWEKYEGRLPSVSNQKQNDFLKELMRLAGITTPVVQVDYRGAQRIEAILPKCELISTHTAKRTFVTILRQRNVSLETIMRMTGNSRRTIETYIVTTPLDARREIEEAWAVA
jgi:integrase